MCQDQNNDHECQTDEPGIPNLIVILNPEKQRTVTERITYTDIKGWFRFENVEPGPHRLRAEDPKGEWLVTPIEIEVATALHQTVQVEIQVVGPVHRYFLPLVSR